MAHGVEIGGLVIALPSWTTYAAVAVSGLTGATYAARRGFDVVGVFGLAIATGLGGLLLRDILLEQGTPVVLTNATYIILAAAVAVVGFFFAGLISQFSPVIVILEGLAIGFMCTVGAQATLHAHLPYPTAIFIGVTTAVGGGVLRDVLSGSAPAIVRPGSFFAVTALLATSVFVGMIWLDLNTTVAQIVTMLVALGANSGAHWLGWHTGTAAELSDRVWDFRSRTGHKVDPRISKSAETADVGSEQQVTASDV